MPSEVPLQLCLIHFSRFKASQILSVGPVAAGLVNKFGCRAVGVAGSLLATVSMFASAFMPTIELMLISYGVIAGESSFSGFTNAINKPWQRNCRLSLRV
ncbi:unnamed protein product [Mesocestoides corti]|uniref:MFS domain-containing protein n=1 Tax=Mesocestoides corti TaxID=53468 RepID=A0A0R3UDE9_MESCO|nr:unnamed protein product [Mesocestoides corti]